MSFNADDDLREAERLIGTMQALLARWSESPGGSELDRLRGDTDDALEVGCWRLTCREGDDCREDGCDCPCHCDHVWVETDTGDAYGPIGGGPGTVVYVGYVCDNCGTGRS
jgi:hypothetical protein